MSALKNRPQVQEDAQIPLLTYTAWQMSFGERAALEGLLAQCRPRLAIEIGTAEGGSLERVAAYSEEVHSFDLARPTGTPGELANVSFHEGDSHVVLPEFLAELAAAGRNVDFVLVDGDHSSDGVRSDLMDLLGSPAVGRALIVVHDTMNEVVREGVERVPFAAYPKVAYVELDFVAGHMFREPSLRHELWGGLGLIAVDSRRHGYFAAPVRQDRYYEAFSLIGEAKRIVASREASETSGHDVSEPSQDARPMRSVGDALRSFRASRRRGKTRT